MKASTIFNLMAQLMPENQLIINVSLQDVFMIFGSFKNNWINIVWDADKMLRYSD